jgi:subtilisin family serine protease
VDWENGSHSSLYNVVSRRIRPMDRPIRIAYGLTIQKKLQPLLNILKSIMIYRYLTLALAAFLALSTAQDANYSVSHRERKSGSIRSSKKVSSENAVSSPQAFPDEDITTFDADAEADDEPAIDLSAPDPVAPKTRSSTPKAPKNMPDALTAPELLTPISPKLGSPGTLRSTESEEEVKRVVITCKPDMTQDECLEQLVGAVPGNSIKVVHALKGLKSLAVVIKTSMIDQLMAMGFNVKEDPIREPLYIKDSIEYHHRDLQSASQVIPYGIDLVKAREVWSSYGVKGEGVKVCVMDTGIAAGHSDFVQSNLSGYSGREAVTPWNSDGQGHGTHVSGTIAAADNNRGVVGVAPGAEIFTVRVFGNNGQFFGSDIVAAAEACRDAGAKIISMSLGGPQYDQDEHDIFQELYSQGILAVAASGNSGGTDYSFPASYDMVLSVAAVDSNRNLASFSTRNNRVDIAAPGECT